MNTNGQLNGTLNGNGAHKPHELLNGNGSLKRGSSYTQRRVPKKSWSELIGAIAVWTFMVLGPCFAVWILFHQPPPPPVAPRIQQIEKTIDNLQDAIDLLRDELPPEDEGDRGYP